MNRRDFTLCFSGAALLLTGAGADALINRGISNPAVLAAACERLNRIPEVIGAWTSTSETIEDRELRLAEISGYIRRTYRHSESGLATTLTVLCGNGGPMSVHPPTACFEGVGYEIVSGPTITGLTDSTDVTVTLNKAAFRLKEMPLSETVRVFWGWSEDGLWDAPSNPRLSYRARPALYKLYAVDRSWEAADELAQSEDFLRQALPVIRDVLKS